MVLKRHPANDAINNFLTCIRLNASMCSNMRIQVAISRISFPTWFAIYNFFTLIWSFSSMNSTVPDQAALSRKSLPTICAIYNLFAFIWFFACMCSHMHIEIGFRSTRLSARDAINVYLTFICHILITVFVFGTRKS